MTNYTASARSTYVSLKVLLLIVGISFGSGCYVGAVFAAYLYALGYPLRWSLVPGAIAALAVWVKGVQLWWQTVRQVESDSFAMAAGRLRWQEPLVIEHRSQEGRVLQPVKSAYSKAELQVAADLLLPLKGQFNLRSLYDLFGQTGAVKFRDWMLREGYASKDDRGWVTLTEAGTAMLKAARSANPSPERDGFIPLYRDRS